MRSRLWLAIAASAAIATPALAQGRPFPRRQGERMQQPSPEQRQELQRRIREELARAAREKVGLSDEQMQKLAPVNRKFAEQRRDLMLQERDVRTQLRRELMDTTSQDQGKIAQYQRQLLDFQRKRLDIAEAEDKELSTFMTPAQVARYRALQEQIRMRVQQMRRMQPRGGPPMQPDTTRPPCAGS